MEEDWDMPPDDWEMDVPEDWDMEFDMGPGRDGKSKKELKLEYY